MKPRPLHLYRCYDAKRVLLYVGISLRIMRRLVEHRERSRWFQSVARITLTRYPTLDALRTAERAAIAAEQPKFNIALVPEQPTPKGAGTYPATVSGEMEGLRLLLAEREETIRDLRHRLDAEAEERRRVQERLTGLLTHRPRGSVPAVAESKPLPWWWRRWFR